MTRPPRKYVFGPVPSRRLGRSLGVDLVPHKVCPLDCLYCQVGRTTEKTARRQPYVPAEEVLAELRRVLDSGVRADFVTLSGSGEPTLHSDLGSIISAIKRMTDIPVAVLTNGVLLNDPAVRAELAAADMVLPSLDAGDEETFEQVNRPAGDVRFADLVEGLKALRREYRGTIRLEVFLLAGVNDGDEQLARIKALTDEIAPDTIDINTVARPPAEPEALAVGPEVLRRARRLLGPKAEIIVPIRPDEGVADVAPEDVLAMLRRRPCTVEDLAHGLGAHRMAVAKLLESLAAEGRVTARRQGEATYYQAT